MADSIQDSQDKQSTQNTQNINLTPEDVALLLQTAMEGLIPAVSTDVDASQPEDLVDPSETIPTISATELVPVVEADSTAPKMVKPKKQTRCGYPDCRKKITIYDFSCKG